MQKRLLMMLFIFCAFLSHGCLARQVARDGEILRQALISMYTDQAIDNLIRAYENQPFVQLKYTMLNVKDTDDATVAGTANSATFTSTLVTDLTKAGASQFARNTNFVGAFPFGGTAQRDRQMAFHADPITNQNYIYEAYLLFARNSSLFKASDHKPGGDVHVCKKCGHKWYWVPEDAGEEFFQLVMKTAFFPAPGPTVPAYWETTIMSVKPRNNKYGNPISGKYVLSLGKNVPNDNGLFQALYCAPKTGPPNRFS